jgi:hypothetical protein
MRMLELPRLDFMPIRSEISCDQKFSPIQQPKQPRSTTKSPSFQNVFLDPEPLLVLHQPLHGIRDSKTVTGTGATTKFCFITNKRIIGLFV